MKLFNKSTAPEEKKSFLEKVRKDPKGPLSVIPTSLLIILPFCICLLAAFLFTLKYIRVDAYNYTDATYEYIEEVLRGVEVTLPDGTVQLENIKVTQSDGTLEEIPPCIRKNEGIDVMELQKHVDKYDIRYENGQTLLTCSIRDGRYFVAEVTTLVSKDFEITSMSRNYNSLGAYMDNLIRQVGLAVLVISLGVFFGVELLIFGGLAAYGYMMNKQEKKKKEQGADAPSAEGAALEVAKTA